MPGGCRYTVHIMLGATAKPFFMLVGAVLLAALALPLGAHATVGKPHVAAMQAALSERGHYVGTIDGLNGPLTREALRGFQRQAGLRPTGKAGARTVSALGGPARRLQAPVVVREGDEGWDVVRLQFLLAWRGFPSGEFDGVFGERVRRATAGFQRWAGLSADGVAGPSTFKALRKARARPHAGLSMPLNAPIGDRFGPRGSRFHAGIDFPAQAGTPVGAIKAGTVVFAAYVDGGFGNLVVVQHRYGLTSRYAHLAEIAVVEGQALRRGETLGSVGSTGRSTGPHLHLEVGFRGALVNPASLLTR